MNEHAVSFRNLNESYNSRQNLYGIWASESKTKTGGNSFWAVLGVLLLMFGAFLIGLFWNEFFDSGKAVEEKDVEKKLESDGNSSVIEMNY
ncbi:hypothetical protein [Arcticibacterium luteifluviistationis]|uniref:Uncharacterized protein n=1 Tax=Arcticibacterium luteifluviistationis TaxID=1784714 RepID=A0A2Z4G931_9BACT|nr:hypothetical protein [Arcticibacterium luteifluviistationis]AWV97701.1 hypothetical protein DJ013_05780 [Arcticibacterium luteifluviistationis]